MNFLRNPFSASSYLSATSSERTSSKILGEKNGSLKRIAAHLSFIAATRFALLENFSMSLCLKISGISTSLAESASLYKSLSAQSASGVFMHDSSSEHIPETSRNTSRYSERTGIIFETSVRIRSLSSFEYLLCGRVPYSLCVFIGAYSGIPDAAHSPLAKDMSFPASANSFSKPSESSFSKTLSSICISSPSDGRLASRYARRSSFSVNPSRVFLLFFSSYSYSVLYAASSSLCSNDAPFSFSFLYFSSLAQISSHSFCVSSPSVTSNAASARPEFLSISYIPCVSKESFAVTIRFLPSAICFFA